MEGTLQQTQGFSRLANIGIVVRDMGNAVAHFESFGIGPFGPLDKKPFGEQKGAGTPSLEARRARLGAGGIELLRPTGGASPWMEFLEKSGEGVMYLSFSVSDIEREEAALMAKGLGPIFRSRYPMGGGAAFFDTRQMGGVVMAVVQAPRGGNSEAEPTPPPFSNLHHIGFVVRDLDATVRYFEGLGFGPFKPLRLLGDRFEQTQYGKPTKYRLKNAGTHIGATKIEFEFLQPLENAPLQEDFLSKKGEGINHLGFKVGDVEAETARMERKAFSVVLTVKFTSGTVCKYLDTSKVGGIMVEFWQLPDPNFRPPA